MTFEHYEIVEGDDGKPVELGAGGMGVTYVARDTRLGRDVVVKMVHPERVSKPEMRGRFLREARAAGKIDHPNVARVLHLGETEDGGVFFAMELCQGISLRQWVKINGPLSTRDAVGIGTQIASALGAVAAAGLIHRDVKPGNIMVFRDGSDGVLRAKLIDFGLARRDRQQKEADGSDREDTEFETLTMSEHGFLGTPTYASPEQAREHPLDIRSDLYSLGASLWHAVTGNVPFEGSSFGELIVKVITEPPNSGELDAKWTDPALRVVLLRLMEKAPDARYQTPAEVIAAFRAILTEDDDDKTLIIDSTFPKSLDDASNRGDESFDSDSTLAKRKKVSLIPILLGLGAVGVVIAFFALRDRSSSEDLVMLEAMLVNDEVHLDWPSNPQIRPQSTPDGLAISPSRFWVYREGQKMPGAVRLDDDLKTSNFVDSAPSDDVYTYRVVAVDSSNTELWRTVEATVTIERAFELPGSAEENVRLGHQALTAGLAGKAYAHFQTAYTESPTNETFALAVESLRQILPDDAENLRTTDKLAAQVLSRQEDLVVALRCRIESNLRLAELKVEPDLRAPQAQICLGQLISRFPEDPSIPDFRNRLGRF